MILVKKKRAAPAAKNNEDDDAKRKRIEDLKALESQMKSSFLNVVKNLQCFSGSKAISRKAKDRAGREHEAPSREQKAA